MFFIALNAIAIIESDVYNRLHFCLQFCLAFDSFDTNPMFFFVCVCVCPSSVDWIGCATMSKQPK